MAGRCACPACAPSWWLDAYHIKGALLTLGGQGSPPSWLGFFFWVRGAGQAEVATPMATTAQEECLCCCSPVQAGDGVALRCPKHHVVCGPCMKQLGRSDCLYCNPANSGSEKRSAPPILCEVLLGTFSFIVSCVSFAAATLITSYGGKVYLWLYIQCGGHQHKIAWFTWRPSAYILSEILVFFLVTFVGGGLLGLLWDGAVYLMRHVISTCGSRRECSTALFCV